jgi:hypothetical protein
MVHVQYHDWQHLLKKNYFSHDNSHSFPHWPCIFRNFNCDALRWILLGTPEFLIKEIL